MTIRTAVITGAASGIGAALAHRLADLGAAVVLSDIEGDRAEQNALAIRGRGGKAIAIAADHSDTESLHRLAAESMAWLGSAPDLVIANAGVGAGGSIVKTPRRNIDWVLAVNVVGPIELAQAFVPAMVETGQPARFAITASEHAVGLPSRGGQASIYTLSKHATLGFAEVLRRDLNETNVAVSVICPAVVNTDIWNTMRNRHDRYGGPRQLDLVHKPDPSEGLSSAVAAERIIAGFEAGEFYVFTHGRDVGEVHRARAEELDGALTRFAQRNGENI
jgi:NAD(P)-dependent dehydrogenase (short-subunit alcohol dehydrogenase family)